MRELRPGLWHWEAPHPEWEPGEPWDRVVSSYAIDDGERLLLFDPLAVPSEIEELAAGRELVVVDVQQRTEKTCKSPHRQGNVTPPYLQFSTDNKKCDLQVF